MVWELQLYPVALHYVSFDLVRHQCSDQIQSGGRDANPTPTHQSMLVTPAPSGELRRLDDVPTVVVVIDADAQLPLQSSVVVHRCVPPGLGVGK
jgi:hypothetical protein